MLTVPISDSFSLALRTRHFWDKYAAHNYPAAQLSLPVYKSVSAVGEVIY